jgi:trehalose 6-phosphate synthase
MCPAPGAVGLVGPARVLVASNRGPVAFALADEGRLTARRGGGGLASGITQGVNANGEFADGDLVWVCAAMSEADRRATRAAPGGRLDRAGHDTGGAAVRMLDIDRVVFDRAYNAVANRMLWFVQHLLFAPVSEPIFGPAFRRDWEAYETYNDMFAEALAAEAAPGASVLIQDYHLMLVPGRLRALRPDLRIAHFSHTPWAPPEYFRLLPDYVAGAVLEGMLGADQLGFLTPTWAGAFRDCCRAVLGVDTVCCKNGNGLDDYPYSFEHRGRGVELGIYPLGVDAAALRARGAAHDVAIRAEELRDFAAGRRLIVRVDRTELSKNIVRGLEAYRELLRAYPQWRGKVTHVACAYPSRHDLPEYREYTAAMQCIAAEIEEEFGTEDWRPLRLDVSDDYPRSLAALSMAEVLLVNPLRDGMNLVAKEGAVLSRPGVALVLSREAGACAEMAGDALVVNPYDVAATAEALHEALLMPAEERRRRSLRLAEVAGRLPPQSWFSDQLRALERPRP